MEQNVITNENKYQFILENANDLIAILNERLEYEYINETVHRKLMGYTSQDLIGKTSLSLIHPDDHEKAVKVWREGFTQGEGAAEIRLKDKAGNYHWLEIRGRTFVDTDGKKKGLVISRDITERKEAELKLKESEEKYRGFVNNISDIIYELDINGKCSYVSHQLLGISGYSPEEMIGQNVFKFVHPDDLTKVAEEIKIAFNFDDKGYIEYRLRHKDGHYVPVSSRFSWITIGEKQKLTGVLVDITERKKAEQELRLQSVIMTNLSEGVHLIKMNDGIIVYTNPRFEEMFGYDPGELIGKHISIVNAPTDKNPEERAKEIMEILEETGEWHGEVNNIKKDGTPFWCYANVSAFDHPEYGKVTVSIHTEITERKKAEKEIINLAKFPSENPNPVLRATKEKVIYINKSGESLLNIREGSSIPPIIQDGVNKALDTNTAKTMEIELNNCIYSIDITPIKGEEYANVYGKDITERKRAEKEIRLHSEIMANLAEGVYLIRTSDLIIVYANPRFEEMFGYNPGEMIGKQATIVNAPTDKTPEETAEDIVGVLERTGEWDGEVNNIKKDGTPFWCYAHVSVFNHSEYGEVLVAVHTDITERKKAENALKKSEEKYRSLVEATSDWIWQVDKEGIYTYSSPRVFNLLGYDPNEIIGKTPFDLMSFEEAKRVGEIFGKVIEAEEPFYGLENESIRKDGQNVILETSGVPIFDSDGLFIGYRGIDRDITERKKAEQKLKDSEEKYRLLFENTMEGIAIHDIIYDSQNKPINYVIRDVNPQFEKLLSLKKEDVINKEVTEAYQVDEAPYLDIYSNIAETMEPTLFETYFPPMDKHFSISVFSTKKRSFITVFEDITNRKIAEKKLIESEEKFRNIAEQSLMGIAILQNDVFKYVNHQYGDIFGYTIEELISFQPGEFIKIVHPKDRDMVEEQKKKKQMSLKDVINHYQFRAVKKMGETMWVEILSKTISYEGGPADLMTIIDITEKKKAEEELKRLNKLKSELLTRSSHELKTPLMSIKGFTELLLLKYKEILYEDELHLVNEIRKGCFRLETLINDILKTAELESGTIHLEKSEEDLSLIIETCVRELKGFADSRNQNINLLIHDKLITSLERKQILQAINNLLNNAIKYTPPNGKIEIHSEIKENFFIISIKDSGIGFSVEEKRRIFKRFGKIERYGQGYNVVSEGSGLGLYISKKIIELHGGKIWVKSEGRSKGSTFYFSLPIMTK